MKYTKEISRIIEVHDRTQSSCLPKEESMNRKITVQQLQALIDRAVIKERERILKKITPALDDFSNAGQIMIKDGRFVNSGNEMLENVGFIKGEFLSHLSDSEK